jgi:hypothetical protein
MNRLLIFIALAFSINSYAQNNDGLKPDDVEAKRQEHYTKELALTPEEGAKFWPFTQSYEQQRAQSKQKIKLAQENMRKAKTQKDFVKALEESDAEKIAMIKNRQLYIKNCYDFLGQDRTLKVLQLEKKAGRMKKERNENGDSDHRPHKKRNRRHQKSGK